MPKLAGDERFLCSAGSASVFDIINVMAPALLATLQTPGTVALGGSLTVNANYGYFAVNSGTLAANGIANVTVTNNRAQNVVHMMCPPIALSGTSYIDAPVNMVPSIHRTGSFVLQITNTGNVAVNLATNPLPVLFEAH